MEQKITPPEMRQLYTVMLRIRLFEEGLADLLISDESIKCPVHLYTGQEAVAAGVCAHLSDDDYVFSTHRSHGHYIAKGGALNALAAEIYGREAGCCRGRGGSMHIASVEKGLPGSSAIVGGTIPIAVGSAMAFRMKRNGSVSVVFFGDGAVNEGVFYEALNFAVLKCLPVVFICENNLYSTHMPISKCLSEIEIYKVAGSFGIPSIRIDGNSAIEVYKTAGEAIDRARSGKGPAFIEYMTYRWRGHVGPNYDVHKDLRSQQELDSWMARCPIRALEGLMIEQEAITAAEKELLEASVMREVAEAFAFGQGASSPKQSSLLDDIFKGESGDL